VYNKKEAATTGTMNRIFWPLLAAIVLAAGWIEVRSARGENQTWDEGIHISSGYSYLAYGDYSWNTEHPPLVKMVSALPLMRMGLPDKRRDKDGKLKNQIVYGIDFLYTNRPHADTILMAARSANILLTLVFVAGVGWWTRRRWGPWAGLCAAALCAFDPNLIAHGRYVTTDYPLTAFFFFACVLWVEYLERGGRTRLFVAAAAIALAMVVKFSAILLVPPLVLLYAFCWIRRPQEFPWWRAVGAFGAVGLVLGAVVLVVYWPETVRCFRGQVRQLAAVVNRENFIGLTLGYVGEKFHLPAHAYLAGLGAVAEHNSGGHDSYLMGLRSKVGLWYYFPVVFAVKSTMAAVAATAVVACACGWALIRRGAATITPMTLGLAVPPLLYFGFSMSSGINLGMRHILPIYPFLYVGVAAILCNTDDRLLSSAGAAIVERGRQKAIVRATLLAAIAALQTAECASIHPDYLAFFNALSGGPGRGPEYLVDSNIDWGQDVKKLARWLEQHGTRRARVYYFGNAGVRYYGIDERAFPDPLDQKGWDAIDDYCVASATPLQGVYVPLADLAPLRLLQPVAKVGWSMYVYDLRKRK
jgi:hypothetical protein